MRADFRTQEGGGFVDFKDEDISNPPLSERRGVVSVFHQLHCLVRASLPRASSSTSRLTLLNRKCFVRDTLQPWLETPKTWIKVPATSRTAGTICARLSRATAIRPWNGCMKGILEAAAGDTSTSVTILPLYSRGQRRAKQRIIQVYLRIHMHISCVYRAHSHSL